MANSLGGKRYARLAGRENKEEKRKKKRTRKRDMHKARNQVVSQTDTGRSRKTRRTERKVKKPRGKREIKRNWLI